jgi:hypothetical protein
MNKVNAFLQVTASKEEQTIITIDIDENGKEKKTKNKQSHYSFPEVPGMQVDVVAVNPDKPNQEQLWVVLAAVPVLHALDLEKEATWLTVKKASGLLKKWGKPASLAYELAEGKQPQLVEP